MSKLHTGLMAAACAIGVTAAMSFEASAEITSPGGSDNVQMRAPATVGGEIGDIIEERSALATIGGGGSTPIEDRSAVVGDSTEGELKASMRVTDPTVLRKMGVDPNDATLKVYAAPGVDLYNDEFKSVKTVTEGAGYDANALAGADQYEVVLGLDFERVLDLSGSEDAYAGDLFGRKAPQGNGEYAAIFSGLPDNVELGRIAVWWTDWDAGTNAPISLIKTCVPFDQPLSGGYRVVMVSTSQFQVVSSGTGRLAYADVQSEQITDTKECSYLLQFSIENAPMKSFQRAMLTYTPLP